MALVILVPTATAQEMMDDSNMMDESMMEQPEMVEKGKMEKGKMEQLYESLADW